jgi:hypothetical protein
VGQQTELELVVSIALLIFLPSIFLPSIFLSFAWECSAPISWGADRLLTS